MSLFYILNQAGNKMGLDPADSSQRSTLVRIVNEAARELYRQADLPGSMYEQVFKVNGDQTITLPEYVGRVRAIREYVSQIPWHINQMRPRYNQYNWTDSWRNIRLKNRQALMTTVTNQSIGVLTVSAVETPPIKVILSGPIEGSANVSETVTMDANSKNTVNQFLDYTTVCKDRVNGYDITLSDVDGKILTVISNNSIKALYQVLDVSICPWLPNNQSTLDNYVEILYKIRLPHLYNDADEFPFIDCDDMVVNKMMELYHEEKGNVEGAIAYDGKATRSLSQELEEENRATEDVVSTVANKHDTMLRRVGSSLGRRFFSGRYRQ